MRGRKGRDKGVQGKREVRMEGKEEARGGARGSRWGMEGKEAVGGKLSSVERKKW